MRSINKVILIGNLTRDPEMRQTPNGQTVTTFGIATNREWMTKNGERKNSAEFHECVAWAKLAEICNTYIRKGRLVYIEGYLKTRSWETPEGIKKFKTEIVVQDMIMLEKKAEEEDYVPESDEEAQEEVRKSDSAKTPENNDSPENTTKKHEDTNIPTETTNEAMEDDKNKNRENPIDKDLGL